jgi:prophage regulatory protein
MKISTPFHLRIMQETGVPDRAVRESECKKITGLSRIARWRLEQKGEFPKPTRISERMNIWPLSEILEWLYQNNQLVTK